jgi:hypothetical protein
MSQSSMHPPVPRCARCGDVIGVYEPAVLVIDGAPRGTSLAAEPAAERGAGAWHHRDCFDDSSAAA